jgi:hypothetical protein
MPRPYLATWIVVVFANRGVALGGAITGGRMIILSAYLLARHYGSANKVLDQAALLADFWTKGE